MYLLAPASWPSPLPLLLQVLSKTEMVDGEHGLRVRSLDDRAGIAEAKRAEGGPDEGTDLIVTISAPFLEEEITTTVCDLNCSAALMAL